MNEDSTKKLPSDFEARVLAELRSINEHMTRFDERMTRVEVELGESRRQTRPLWDTFLMRLTNIEQTVQSINAQIGEFAREFFTQRGRIALLEEEVRHRPPTA